MPNTYLFLNAHDDNDFAHKIAGDLEEAGIPVWIDVKGLTPGTPNWEQAIRDAISEAGAVLLIASPDSRQSVFVHGELTLAKIRQRIVVPVWAQGENWIDCVPLDMVNYQYIDCRDTNYSHGVHNLVETIKNTIYPLEGIVRLGLPTHETIELNLLLFSSIFDAVNHIYLNYLQDWYESATYGTDWVLANVHTKRLGVPWDWVLLGPNDRNPATLFRLYSEWNSLTYKDFGIERNSHWAVWDLARIRAAGVAVNSEALANRLLSQYSSRDLSLLHTDGCLKAVQSRDLDPQNYKFTFVLALFGAIKQYNRVTFIESDKPCD